MAAAFFVLAATLFLLTACSQQTEQAGQPQANTETQAQTQTQTQNTSPSAVTQQGQIELLLGAKDELRAYSYDPASISTLSENDDDNIIEVFVRVDYVKNLGSIVAENQIWRIDLEKYKYKVIESATLDQEGKLCPT